MRNPPKMSRRLRAALAAGRPTAAWPAAPALLRLWTAIGRALVRLREDCPVLPALDTRTLRDLGFTRERHWSAAADPAAVRARLVGQRCGLPF